MARAPSRARCWFAVRYVGMGSVPERGFAEVIGITRPEGVVLQDRRESLGGVQQPFGLRSRAASGSGLRARHSWRQCGGSAVVAIVSWKQQHGPVSNEPSLVPDLSEVAVPVGGGHSSFHQEVAAGDEPTVRAHERRAHGTSSGVPARPTGGRLDHAPGPLTARPGELVLGQRRDDVPWADRV
jgi:hypothetical protein